MTTNQSAERLRHKLSQICDQWIAEGLPSREVLERTADELDQWKQSHQIVGIWPSRPRIATATLDDGIGQGISIIERYAEVVGLKVEHLGLMQPSQTIIDRCLRIQPAFLGLTVLQLDSDDALAEIGRSLPAEIRLIAGGPVFKFDPDMADRCRVDYVAPSAAHFVNYLLKWTP